MIFLARFDIETHHYMGKTVHERGQIRLIDADCMASAEIKLRNEYEHSGPGDDSVYVESVDISEIIR